MRKARSLVTKSSPCSIGARRTLHRDGTRGRVPDLPVWICEPGDYAMWPQFLQSLYYWTENFEEPCLSSMQVTLASFLWKWNIRTALLVYFVAEDAESLRAKLPSLQAIQAMSPTILLSTSGKKVEKAEEYVFSRSFSFSSKPHKITNFLDQPLRPEFRTDSSDFGQRCSADLRGRLSSPLMRKTRRWKENGNTSRRSSLKEFLLEPR